MGLICIHIVKFYRQYEQTKGLLESSDLSRTALEKNLKKKNEEYIKIHKAYDEAIKEISIIEKENSKYRAEIDELQKKYENEKTKLLEDKDTEVKEKCVALEKQIEEICTNHAEEVDKIKGKCKREMESFQSKLKDEKEMSVTRSKENESKVNGLFFSS